MKAPVTVAADREGPRIERALMNLRRDEVVVVFDELVEIGRRIDVTIRNNVLKIDNDAVFLKSFRAKARRPGSYVGFGKHIDALVRLAFHTQDKKLIELKDHLIAELIKTQLPTGYIGIFGKRHMQIDWDLHEASYVVFALVSDYEHFGSKASLEAAKKLADYIDGNISAR